MPPPPGLRMPPLLLLLLAAACGCGLTCAGEGRSCEFSVARGNELYSFDLAAPTPAHRHGVLSEDGFYKVAVNDSILWFQLCDEMLFNFDPPLCLNCEDCGGPLRCGTQCSALVSNYIRGYDVCTTIGSLSKSHISLVDESNPQKGVIVKMFSSKCSISVSVLCDSTATQVPDKFVVSGLCDYATTLKHPSGCARSVSASGNGWGWLSTLFITVLCLLGGYILIGAVYRYYFLGIHSVEAIPNLEFWIGLPQRIKTVFVPATRSHLSTCMDWTSGWIFVLANIQIPQQRGTERRRKMIPDHVLVISITKLLTMITLVILCCLMLLLMQRMEKASTAKEVTDGEDPF